MKNILKFTLFLSLLMLTINVNANDDVKFVASAPNAVAVGQPFKLVYTLNQTGKNIQLPSINGFEIIAGPFTSTSSSTQWDNGKMSSSKEVMYTYTLLADKEGEYTVPAATITVDKKQHKSNALRIKVVPADKPAAGQSSTKSNNSPVQTSQSISKETLFIRPVINKTNVCEQEAISLTYKIYTKVDLVDIQQPKFPDFNGFFVQEIELPTNRQLQVENFNGANYYTYELRKVLLFPQRAGKITIDNMSCDVVVRMRNQRQSRGFFDDIFAYNEVKKSVTSTSLTVNVSPLPQPKPADFGGIVGNFSIESSISEVEVNANEPITIKVKVSGSGNMKMIKNAQFKFPADFEVYDPTVTNNFKVTPSGLAGSKTMEYLVIPRHKGDFTVPARTFSYYNPETKTYNQLSTNEFNIKVNKGDSTYTPSSAVSNFASQERVELIGTDIRYIKPECGKLINDAVLITGTLLFWLAFILPFLLALALLYFFRKQAKENANEALVRNKKANKMVQRRLKVASVEYKAGRKDTFYDEILKALWGYLCDKLSMPLSELNKENVSQKLADRNVDENIIGQFISLLDNCEFERYAPLSDTKSAMDKIYNDTVNMISTLESAIKKQK
ncbi:MAG: BatD family protein [bacterium]